MEGVNGASDEAADITLRREITVSGAHDTTRVHGTALESA